MNHFFSNNDLLFDLGRFPFNSSIFVVYHHQLHEIQFEFDDINLDKEEISSAVYSSPADQERCGGVVDAYDTRQQHSQLVEIENDLDDLGGNDGVNGAEAECDSRKPYSRQYPNDAPPFNIRYLHSIPSLAKLTPLTYNVLPLRKDFRFGLVAGAFLVTILNLCWITGLSLLLGVEDDKKFVSTNMFLFLPTTLSMISSLVTFMWTLRLASRVEDRLIITSYPTTHAILLPPPPKIGTAKPKGCVHTKLSLAYISANKFRNVLYYINFVNMSFSLFNVVCFIVETVFGSSNWWGLMVVTIVFQLLFAAQNYKCVVIECDSRREYTNWIKRPCATANATAAIKPNSLSDEENIEIELGALPTAQASIVAPSLSQQPRQRELEPLPPVVSGEYQQYVSDEMHTAEVKQRYDPHVPQERKGMYSTNAYT